jgi:hypothetical protein
LIPQQRASVTAKILVAAPGQIGTDVVCLLLRQLALETGMPRGASGRTGA